LVARDIEVEFVNFGKPLPQKLDARSASTHFGKSGTSWL
jgi:hypothetical protein